MARERAKRTKCCAWEKATPCEPRMGAIRVKLLMRGSGNTRVDLCRNGMWITDDKTIPGFYGKFQDRIPFHAVLLLNSDEGKELHSLVRDSEGPLHDSMSTKDLPVEDKRKLLDTLGGIRTWLLSNTSEISEASYSPDDFLTIDFGDEGEAQGGASRHAVWGTPTAVGQTEHRSSHVSPHPPDPEPNPESRSAATPTETSTENSTESSAGASGLLPGRLRTHGQQPQAHPNRVS